MYGRPEDDYLDLIRGAGDPRERDGGPTRHLLHCARMVFPDPAGGAELEVRAPLPADFGLPDHSEMP